MTGVKVLVVLSVVLASCATQLTTQGQSVRMVDRQSDYDCDFVGTVTGSNSLGNTKAHDAEGAMNEMRNAAADMGANAVRLLNLDVTYETTTALGEALICKFD